MGKTQLLIHIFLHVLHDGNFLCVMQNHMRGYQTSDENPMKMVENTNRIFLTLYWDFCTMCSTKCSLVGYKSYTKNIKFIFDEFWWSRQFKISRPMTA